MSRTLITVLAVFLWCGVSQAGESTAQGSLPYDRFEESSVCADCHTLLSTQYNHSLMAQSFTHAWDEKEYFELAVPHAEKFAKVEGIKAGCNGCHAPLAYLAGDIPPQHPEAGTRANEGVSCDICHSITGFDGEIPFNFNYVMEPGETKQGTRPGRESDHHEIAVNDFLKSAEFCGICHNEQDPFGMWVKATHLEWREGPYGKAGIVCQQCHMPAADGALVEDGDMVPGARQHTFAGVHFPQMTTGAVQILLYPREESVSRGGTVVLDATVMNTKAGHMIPTGSAEERVVWMDVEAIDSAGNHWHLAVDRKGFAGEDWTIADPGALAYQDIAEIQDLQDFEGLSRDGAVPAGDRIFRMPYLDPQGRMTIAQWNTASFGPDYRLPPLKGVNESYTWKLPTGVAPGRVEVTATVYMTRVVSSVADFMGLPEGEKEPMPMGTAQAVFTVN